MGTQHGIGEATACTPSRKDFLGGPGPAGQAAPTKGIAFLAGRGLPCRMPEEPDKKSRAPRAARRITP